MVENWQFQNGKVSIVQVEQEIANLKFLSFLSITHNSVHLSNFGKQQNKKFDEDDKY